MTRRGQVYAIRGTTFVVHAQGERVCCSVRKKLKREPREGGKVAVVGDLVEWTPSGPGEGIIEAFLPRRTRLSRRDPVRPNREQVIVANVDLLLAVQALVEPRFDPRVLDRCLVMAGASGIEAAVVLNKTDLADASEAAATYTRTGYTVVCTSARTGAGIAHLSALLRGRTCVLLGPSGVGKSSLLNALDPSLDLPVGEVSAKTGEGRHTTTWVELLPLAGGAVVDTPGMEFFTLWGVREDNLASFFPEFGEFSGACKFRDCRHAREPNCAVRQAVESGGIPRTRYESYLDMREEITAPPRSRRRS